MNTAPRQTVGPIVDRTFQRNLTSRTPTSFRHGLVGHPLLTLDAIAQLGTELPARSLSAEVGEKPLAAGSAAGVAVPVEDIAEQIRQIAANSSWFTLLHIHQVDRYQRLVDEILDGLAASSGLPASSLRRRMGFLFASSPKAVTAAHFDIEHSFCMQLEGTRMLGFGKFADAEQREEHVKGYWNGDFGRFGTLPEVTAEYEIGPGDGCYIPPYTPHWITNYDNTSLSLTVTFFNDDNENESLVQAFNTKMQKLGANPPAYGLAPGRDRAKVGFMKAYGGAKRRLRLGSGEPAGSH
ncbi:MAG: Transcription factor jumonji, jmjC [Nocardioides sp.]|nr:Transcription factor jumonji, jmjC [Nocardioides sp.]